MPNNIVMIAPNFVLDSDSKTVAPIVFVVLVAVVLLVIVLYFAKSLVVVTT